MKLLFMFIIILVFKNAITKEKTTTLGIHERVAMLKKKIAQEMDRQRSSQKLTPIVKSDDIFDNYEYEDNANGPITPIMDSDVRKIRDKFKLRQLKTTPNHSGLKETVEQEDKDPLRSKRHKKDKKRKHTRSKPVDIFYRRQIDDEMRNTPLEWTHCQDLITPFFTGHKSNISVAKRLVVKDHVVMRLIQLLSLNTTGFTKDDIYSVMYQISNLQLRFFQWDVAALKVLLNIVIKDKNHGFYHLKHGIKRIFNAWHLDITNTSNLLKQARIFRPPCVRISDYGGSTKTSRGLRYTKTVKKKKQCPIYDDDCEDM